MKHSKKHSTSDRSIEKKFRNVQNTQEGIQSLTVWAIHHQDQAEKIVTIWAKIFLESEAPHTLTLMYCCNDIVQNCKRKNALVYKDLFKLRLPEVLSHMSKDDSVIPPAQRIFKIWSDRLVFEEDVISELQECLISDELRDKMQQDEIDKKLLAEFKPNKVVESLRGFRRLELDADLKYRRISNIKLDLTNSEAIKQLKDRAHGNEYTKEFEDHTSRLEEFRGDLLKVMQERTALIELLELTEHFYELQYGEALVVANAYKNFGLRVAKQEVQLDDLVKTFPGSPISGSVSASPAQSSGNHSQVIDMEMSDDERGEDDEPPVEPYSPSMIDSPERPVGSPISPNTSLTDLDIVKGVAQPYDPTETQVTFCSRGLLDDVYNPKAALDTRSNDISQRLQNLMPGHTANTSFNTDGDGTPTQDEYMDSGKHAEENDSSSVKQDTASNEDDWDLAYEFLEENMETTNSGAVSISNLTTIQPTTDFTALTNNTTTDLPPKGILKTVSLPDTSKLHGRGIAMAISMLNDTPNLNGSHSSSGSSPAVGPVTSPPSLCLASAVSAAVSVTLARSNAEPVLAQNEDPNAKAQREFLERLTQRGPFKPSRFLQKLTEEKKKIVPPDSIPIETPISQYGQFVAQEIPGASPAIAGIRHQKVEYQLAGSTMPESGLVPPGHSPGVIVSGEQRIPPGQPAPPPLPAFPGASALKMNDHGLSLFPTSGEFPPMDQDMRQFNPARPPPPPPPPPQPQPFVGNVTNVQATFPAPRKPFPAAPQSGHPPPPPPDFAFRRMVPSNSRVDPPPGWRGVPPPGPPPPFFRPRFS